MSPSNILKRADESGLNLIAITDHNMSENCIALKILSEDSPVEVLFGMEINTQEEIHALCFFDRLSQALNWQNIVYENLPDIENNPDYFGYQVVVDENEDIVGSKRNFSSTPLLFR